MTRELRYTLLTDGPSDDALIPLLSWLLRERGAARALVPNWADLRRLRQPPRGLTERIRSALLAYPCDLLFIHRDAERDPPESRHEEIRAALVSLQGRIELPHAVAVVPVRMMEAWLLFDEQALRRAAGNPHGKVALSLPRVSELESVPDPKEALYDLLRRASELRGRRLRSFSARGLARRVADFLDDFSPLRSLITAFRKLERDVDGIVRRQGWHVNDE